MPAIPAESETEWPLLLAACSALPPDAQQRRLRSLLEAPVDWRRLLLLAERQGVQPLLCQALNSVRDAVPKQIMDALEQNYATNLRKSLLLCRELIRILHHLRKFDVDVVPHKGPTLAEFLYGDVALRQAGDIDLLVRREQFSRVENALAEIGYLPQTSFSDAQQRDYLQFGYECVFDGPAGRNVLEVQWAVQPRFYAVDFEMDRLFDLAVEINVTGQRMKTLSAANLFLVLSVHAAKHVWGRLIWICDFAQLMNLASLDWEWIASQAKVLGVLRIVNISMLLANRLLGAEVPAHARRRFREERTDAQIASEIQQEIFRDSDFNVESISYFRLMMKLRERLSDRLRFATRLAFTPGPGEWNAVRFPSRLFPLYRAVRISRLLARVVDVRGTRKSV